MRWMCLPMLLWAQLACAASAQQKIEDLAQQVAPLWQTMRPLCVMAVQADLQPGLQARLDYLDNQLLASNLIVRLVDKVGADASSAWRSPVWALQEQLERAALDPSEREPLREYYFKLQTQTPGEYRAQLVADVQHMSEQLNMSLREQLWKSCHALGLSQLSPEQIEEVVAARWRQQSARVQKQLHDELSAFYFYSFRSVENAELMVMANLSKQLKPWVGSAKLAIADYFASMRGQLVAYPVQALGPASDGTLPAARPWRPQPQL